MTANLAISEADRTQGKFWFLLTGGLSILAGMVAIGWPTMASVAITQFIGAMALVTGVFLLFSALFGRARQHRLLDFFSALLRLAVGVLLIVNVFRGVAVLTLVLACVFIAEGIYGAVLAFSLRGKHSAWGWVLVNGIVAILLGGMLLAKFPSTAGWAIGLLFGINSLFLGMSLLMYGLGLSRAQAA